MSLQRRSRQAAGLMVALVLVLGGCGNPRPVATPSPAPPKEATSSVVVFQGGETLKESAEAVVSESFKLGDKTRVVVGIFTGPITVTVGADHIVTAKVTKKAFGETKEEAAKKLKAVAVTLTKQDDTVRITADRPKDMQVVAQVVTVLEVPATAELDLKSQNSGVEVSGVRGDITARTSSGGMIVNGAEGVIHLTTSFDKMEITGPTPKVTARNSSGSITVRTTQGKLDLVTRNASIRIDAASPDVKAESSSGAITVRQAIGTLNLSTSFDSIDVDAQDATLNAVNSSGSIQFTGSLAAGKHLFRTTNCGVTLTLPADATFALDAQTSFGKVTSQFPMKLSTNKETHLVGTAGDNPPVSVTVRASSGDVEVRKGK